MSAGHPVYLPASIRTVELITNYYGTRKFREQTGHRAGYGRFCRRSGQRMALPLYDRTERRCGIHPALYRLHLPAWHSRHAQRIHRRSPCADQCSAGLRQAEWWAAVATGGLSGHPYLHHHSWLLCRGGRLVPAVSVCLAGRTGAGRCRLCQKLFRSLLVQSREARAVGCRLRAGHPSGGGAWRAPWHRARVEVAHAHAALPAAGAGGGFVHAARSHRGRAFPAHARLL